MLHASSRRSPLAEAARRAGRVAPLNHAVHDAVGQRLLAGEVATALHGGLEASNGLRRVLGVDLVHARARPGSPVDLHIGRLPVCKTPAT